MTREEAILYLEHTGGDDFNLEEHQIQNRLNAIQFLLEENKKIKKQLEETDRKLFLTKNELDMREKSIDNKLNQQKEFIKSLEDMLDNESDIFSVVRVKDVLQNYKQIIGGK